MLKAACEQVVKNTRMRPQYVADIHRYFNVKIWLELKKQNNWPSP
jgi:hypothetical protein